jgi:predicted metalloprotease with PDZ domain
MADHELEELPVVVALLDERSCRLAASLDADSAVTLIAVASEDPSSWDEIVSYWPRYRTPEMS